MSQPTVQSKVVQLDKGATAFVQQEEMTQLGNLQLVYESKSATDPWIVLSVLN
jgi:hypothetical protein